VAVELNRSVSVLGELLDGLHLLLEPGAGTGRALRNLASKSRSIGERYVENHRNTNPQTGQPHKVGASPILSPRPEPLQHVLDAGPREAVADAEGGVVLLQGRLPQRRQLGKESGTPRERVRPASRVLPAYGIQGKFHRVDPDFGSTLTASNRTSQSNCWVNWKIMGQPCEFQVPRTDSRS
jgi:hypothetical protein